MVSQSSGLIMSTPGFALIWLHRAKEYRLVTLDSTEIFIYVFNSDPLPKFLKQQLYQHVLPKRNFIKLIEVLLGNLSPVAFFFSIRNL